MIKSIHKAIACTALAAVLCVGNLAQSSTKAEVKPSKTQNTMQVITQVCKSTTEYSGEVYDALQQGATADQIIAVHLELVQEFANGADPVVLEMIHSIVAKTIIEKSKAKDVILQENMLQCRATLSGWRTV